MADKPDSDSDNEDFTDFSDSCSDSDGGVPLSVPRAPVPNFVKPAKPAKPTTTTTAKTNNSTGTKPANINTDNTSAANINTDNSANDSPTTPIGPAVWVPGKGTNPTNPKVLPFHMRPSSADRATSAPFMSAPKGYQPPPPGYRYVGEQFPRRMPGHKPAVSRTAPTSHLPPIPAHNTAFPPGRPQQDYAIFQQKIREHVASHLPPEELTRLAEERAAFVEAAKKRGEKSWLINEGVRPPWNAERKAAADSRVTEEQRREKKEKYERERAEREREERETDWDALQREHEQKYRPWPPKPGIGHPRLGRPKKW